VSSRRALTGSQWLDAFSRIGVGVRRVVLPLSGTEAGRAPLTVGAGGDTTIELDRAAEAVVLGELAGLAERGETFTVLSGEISMFLLCVCPGRHLLEERMVAGTTVRIFPGTPHAVFSRTASECVAAFGDGDPRHDRDRVVILHLGSRPGTGGS